MRGLKDYYFGGYEAVVAPEDKNLHFCIFNLSRVVISSAYQCLVDHQIWIDDVVGMFVNYFVRMSAVTNCFVGQCLRSGKLAQKPGKWS